MMYISFKKTLQTTKKEMLNALIKVLTYEKELCYNGIKLEKR